MILCTEYLLCAAKAYPGEMAKQVLISPKHFSNTTAAVNRLGLSLNEDEGACTLLFLIRLAEIQPYTSGGGGVRAFQMSLTVCTHVCIDLRSEGV